MPETGWVVLWTERSDRDLGRALQYLRRRSPRAAERWLRDLLHRVGLLADQPELGASVQLAGASTPYRRLSCGDYVVFYRIDAAARAVFVIRVWHAARNPADLFLD